MAKKSTDKRLYESHLRLKEMLSKEPLLLQGSVIDVQPKTNGGKTTYVWTRKVNGKTVTKALSKPQAKAFRKAIQKNREVSQLLKDITKLSEAHILETVEGVKPKPRKTS